MDGSELFGAFRTSYASWAGEFILGARLYCEGSGNANFLKRHIVPRIAAIALLVILPLQLVYELPATLLIFPLFLDGAMGRSARNSLGTIATIIKSLASIITGKLPGYKPNRGGFTEVLQDLVIQPALRLSQREALLERRCEIISKNLTMILKNFDFPTTKEECDRVGNQLTSIARRVVPHTEFLYLSNRGDYFKHDNHSNKSIINRCIEKIVLELLDRQQNLPPASLIKAVIEQDFSPGPISYRLQELMKKISPSQDELLDLIGKTWEGKHYPSLVLCDTDTGALLPSLSGQIFELLREKLDIKNLAKDKINRLASMPIAWTNPTAIDHMIQNKDLDPKALLTMSQIKSEDLPSIIKKHQKRSSWQRELPLLTSMHKQEECLKGKGLSYLLPWLLEQKDFSQVSALMDSILPLILKAAVEGDKTGHKIHYYDSDSDSYINPLPSTDAFMKIRPQSFMIIKQMLQDPKYDFSPNMLNKALEVLNIGLQESRKTLEDIDTRITGNTLEGLMSTLQGTPEAHKLKELQAELEELQKEKQKTEELLKEIEEMRVMIIFYKDDRGTFSQDLKKLIISYD